MDGCAGLSAYSRALVGDAGGSEGGAGKLLGVQAVGADLRRILVLGKSALEGLAGKVVAKACVEDDEKGQSERGSESR